MGLKDDLQNEVKAIFATQWQIRDGKKVPETEELKLGNDAVKIKATVLYADLAESTSLVDHHKPHFAAEIYKSYLHCASKIIRSENGVITAFDGDRVMGVFIGDTKNTSAARCALKINHAVVKILNPAIKQQYPQSTYTIKQSVGVDNCELLVSRTGVRGSNDLVWVGRAANYAAKLCSLRESNYTSYITADVYNSMHDSVKYTDKKPMWENRTWTAKNMTVYRSNWMWTP
ncbi:MAG: adenylate/guanylate cyclase domain-containing protein [Pyrinomonadaceae bacterium]